MAVLDPTGTVIWYSMPRALPAEGGAAGCRRRTVASAYIDRERLLTLARHLGRGDYARYLERLPGLES